ncbi:Sensor histidine kinase CitA [Calidithermus terrae]|uniref:histidine kinase n=1 Tax=Calidithermus terrae TaxID=1408545 RepID=A0A399EE20_9DEIN|nr:sensor histidine kinase [Calidithermus terrae]RIH81783.1 Sensor histidine kinase CitA [Calidithermus terrae]
MSLARAKPRTASFLPRPASRRLGIQMRFFLLQVAVFTLLMGVLAGVQVAALQRSVRSSYGERALMISRTVATIPEVVAAFDDPDPSRTLNPLVNRIRERVGADYIVVGDKRGIRLAHPLPDRLGKPMVGGDNAEPLAGREIISVATGSLGAAIRGKVPVRDAAGRVVGVVSTGYLLPTVQSIALEVSATLLPWFGLGLVFALLSSVWLSRRIKRAMLELEPEQIAALVQQHRSVLSALQEGVLVVDAQGHVQIANPKAAQMLGIRGELDAPLPLEGLWPELARSGLLAGGNTENEPLHVGNQPVLVGVLGMPGGQRLVVFRDRAEILQMAEELTQTRRYAELLRAQTHEFQNRLHTIAGLIELERPAEALAVIQQEAGQVEALRDRVAGLELPRLAALILGKYQRARELGIRLRLEPGSALSAAWAPHSQTLELVLGNLLDNAFEAVLEKPRGEARHVSVMLGEDPEGLQLEVSDDGPGVAPELGRRILERGVSTRGEGRGLGLHLVQQHVEPLGGELSFFRRGGRSVFRVSLPASALPGGPA